MRSAVCCHARIQEFSSGGGGGGVYVNRTKKALTTFFFFFFFFFLSPQLILQKSNGWFQRKISFFKVPEGSKFFQWGGGATFSRGGGGSNCLFPIETHITCDFPGGSGPPVPPLDPHLAAIYLVSQSAKWCDRLLHLCLFSCNFVVCFQSSPTIKSFLELTAWLLPCLSNIFCNSSLLSSITQ